MIKDLFRLQDLRVTCINLWFTVISNKRPAIFWIFNAFQMGWLILAHGKNIFFKVFYCILFSLHGIKGIHFNLTSEENYIILYFGFFFKDGDFRFIFLKLLKDTLHQDKNIKNHSNVFLKNDMFLHSLPSGCRKRIYVLHEEICTSNIAISSTTSIYIYIYI